MKFIHFCFKLLWLHFVDNNGDSLEPTRNPLPGAEFDSLLLRSPLRFCTKNTYYTLFFIWKRGKSSSPVLWNTHILSLFKMMSVDCHCKINMAFVSEIEIDNKTVSI